MWPYNYLCLTVEETPPGKGMWLGQSKSSWVGVQLRSSDFQSMCFSHHTTLSPYSEKNFEAHMLFKRSSSNILVQVPLLWGRVTVVILKFWFPLANKFQWFLKVLQNNPSINWRYYFFVNTKEGAYSLDWVLVASLLPGAINWASSR